MKTTPQQNKLLVPILVLTLIGLVARIGTLLRGDDAPAPVVTPAAAGAVTPTAARQSADLHETSDRDPFFHPSLVRAAQADHAFNASNADTSNTNTSNTNPRQPQGIPADGQIGVPLVPQIGGALPAMPFGSMRLGVRPALSRDGQPYAAHPWSAGGVATVPAKATTTSVAGAADGKPLPGSHADLVSRLKLKAVLDGNRPAAVIEGYGAQPLIVHVGEAVGPLRLDVVRAAEVVLSSPQGFWTLPLDTLPPADSTSLADARKEDITGANH